MSCPITPILMPKWGLAMKEGRLAAWHVEEGSEISQGDEIMDVETDKISNAVEAPDAGLLRRRVATEGEIYPVGALLGVLAPPDVSEADIGAYIDAFEMPVVEEDEETAPAYEFADLAVGRIRYTSRDGDGVPVVLVHGFGGDLDNWLFNIDAVSALSRVYALDLPGHGQSVKVADDPTLELLVQAVIQVLDHVGVERAHLVGHSMGALVSGQVAVLHPDRVASLVLIGAAGLGTDVNSAYIEDFVGAASRRELKPVLKHLFADQSLVSRSMVDDLLAYKRLDGVQAFLESLRASMFPDGAQARVIADALASFAGPVRIVWGEQDAIIPASHAGAVEGASATVIPGAGHMVQMEAASQVNEIIGDHISRAAD